MKAVEGDGARAIVDLHFDHGRRRDLSVNANGYSFAYIAAGDSGIFLHIGESEWHCDGFFAGITDKFRDMYFFEEQSNGLRVCRACLFGKQGDCKVFINANPDRSLGAPGTIGCQQNNENGEQIFYCHSCKIISGLMIEPVQVADVFPIPQIFEGESADCKNPHEKHAPAVSEQWCD